MFHIKELSMLVIIFMCVIQSIAFSQVSTGFIKNPKPICNPIDTFSTTFYSSIMATYGSDTLFGIQLPGELAAALLYQVLVEDLTTYGLKNPSPYAEVARAAVAKANPFTLPLFFKKTGHFAGTLLFRHGFLDCSNAASTAGSFARVVQKEMWSLDRKRLDSYLHARVRGQISFLNGYGFKGGEAAEEISRLFASEY